MNLVKTHLFTAYFYPRPYEEFSETYFAAPTP